MFDIFHSMFISLCVVVDVVFVFLDNLTNASPPTFQTIIRMNTCN